MAYMLSQKGPEKNVQQRGYLPPLVLLFSEFSVYYWRLNLPNKSCIFSRYVRESLKVTKLSAWIFLHQPKYPNRINTPKFDLPNFCRFSGPIQCWPFKFLVSIIFHPGKLHYLCSVTLPILSSNFDCDRMPVSASHSTNW